jgi:enediyne biosynthesis protein E5
LITDPKTTPPTIKSRICFALLITLVDAYLRIHSITNSLFYASFLVTLFVGLPYQWNRAKNSKWEFHIQEKK